MFQAGPGDDPRGPAAGWLHLGHQALTTSVQRPDLLAVPDPSSVDARRAAPAGGSPTSLPCGGTIVVLGISHAPRTVENLLVVAAAEVLMTIGLIIMVIGLASLGRSFGIMPRARGLVQSGLYRWVRHPIYLGEFLVFAGIMILAISPLTLAIYAHVRSAPGVSAGDGGADAQRGLPRLRRVSYPYRSAAPRRLLEQQTSQRGSR